MNAVDSAVAKSSSHITRQQVNLDVKNEKISKINGCCF